MGVLHKVAVLMVALTMIVAGGLKVTQLLAGESGFITFVMAALDFALAGGLLVTRWQQCSAMGVVLVCLGGVTWALFLPGSSCSCFGKYELGANTHLILAGLLGATALSLVKGAASEEDVVIG
jgi:hypothetical protein